MHRFPLVALLLVLGGCGTETALLGEGEFCTDSAQCAKGLTCQSNACSQGSTVSTSCYTSAQCSGGKLCIGGYCKDPVSCSTIEDCGSGTECVDGKCLPKTDSDNVEQDVIPDANDTVEPTDLVDDKLPGDSHVEVVPDVPETTPCANASECNDANSCTTDKCENNKCVYTMIAGEGCCQVKEECTAGNACQTPKCSQFNCFYVTKANCCMTDAECDDQLFSTADTCSNHECVHEELKTCQNAIDCDDSNACSVDACVQNLCSYSPSTNPLCCLSDQDCNDNDATTEDVCLENSCYFKPEGTCLLASECDDLNSCTFDSCQDTACVNSPNMSTACNCTSDLDCAGGKGGACIPFEIGPSTVVQACYNAVGPKAAGQACSLDSDCITGICQPTASGNLCFGVCTTDSQCYPGTDCGEYSMELTGGTSVTVKGCVPEPTPCYGDKNCPAEAFCGVTMGDLPNTIKTVCQVPGDGTKTVGQECTTDDECRSGLCYNMWEKNKSICWAACTQDSDCTTGFKCYPYAVTYVFDQATPATPDDQYYAISACQPDKGSFNSCLADGDCTTAEFCYPYTNQTSTALDSRCITKFGSVKGGGPCASDTQCRSGICIDSSTDYCFALCKSGDCYTGTTCKTVNSFIVNDKGDTDPTNDIVTTVSVCIPNS